MIALSTVGCLFAKPLRISKINILLSLNWQNVVKYTDYIQYVKFCLTDSDL